MDSHLRGVAALVVAGVVISVVAVKTPYFSGEASPQQQESAPIVSNLPISSPPSKGLKLRRTEGVVVDASFPNREVVTDPVIEVEQLTFSADVDPSAGTQQFIPEEPIIGGQAIPGPEAGQVKGEIYTWLDGNRTQEVWLQPDLVVTSEGDITSKGSSEANSSGKDSRSTAAPTATAKVSEGYPVFRSPSGTLMTLPGGAIVVLDADLTTEQVEAFLSANGISTERVSELGWLPNGFFIDTDPGFASLELANELAVQAGVRLSSPNWWMEHASR